MKIANQTLNGSGMKKMTAFKIRDSEGIDSLAESQADNDEVWDAPIQVKKKQETSLSLPADLATRAAFLAKLHKEPNSKEWLRRIIAERIELEESAFMDFKRTLASNPPRLTSVVHGTAFRSQPAW